MIRKMCVLLFTLSFFSTQVYADQHKEEVTVGEALTTAISAPFVLIKKAGKEVLFFTGSKAMQIILLIVALDYCNNEGKSVRKTCRAIRDNKFTVLTKGNGLPSGADAFLEDAKYVIYGPAKYAWNHLSKKTQRYVKRKGGEITDAAKEVVE